MNSRLGFIIFLSFLSLPALAEVSVRWLGVGGLIIEDEATRLMIDPAFTKPSWRHYLNLIPLRSDTELVEGMLKRHQINKLDAVLITHSHFDHSIDATEVARLTRATLYADPYMTIIAKAHKSQVVIKPLGKLQVGKFIITPIKRNHSKLLGFLDFLPGNVPADFDFSFYDYKAGSSWGYLIEHSHTTILIEEIAAISPELSLKKIDVVIQSVAGRKGSDILSGIVKRFKPKLFIPIHFDNFFFDINESKPQHLPGIDLESLESHFKEVEPTTKFFVPVFGQKIKL